MAYFLFEAIKKYSLKHFLKVVLESTSVSFAIHPQSQSNISIVIINLVPSNEARPQLDWIFYKILFRCRA